MESHLSRPPLPRLQGNRTWRFQRLAWTRGAPGALSWTTDRDVGAACIHNSLSGHIVRRFATMTIHTRKSQLIVHQAHPFNAELPGDLLRQSFLTPQEHFYVRTH